MSSALCPSPTLMHDLITLGVGVAAGIGGSFLTVRLTRSNRAAAGARIVDQSSAKAGGDNVGGDKVTNSNNQFRP